MRYLIAALLICLTVTPAQAFEFQEIPEKDAKIVARAVFLHSGPGEKLASIGMCRTGYIQLMSDNGDELMEFLSPCIMGGMELGPDEKPTAQIGIGVIELIDLISANIAMDTRNGDFFWGMGISMEIPEF